MKFAVVIPARYASERLPGKPLAMIGGQPMIRRVWRRAMDSGATSVIVATDHARVAEACHGFGAEVCMTDAGHASGTDRIAEVADQRGWEDEALVVNVQGDEPFVPPSVVRQAAELLVLHPQAEIATLATPINDLQTFLDPNVVKVVASRSGEALYFSRAPIPWDRAGASARGHAQTRWTDALRHVGLYAYRVGALRRLAAAAPCRLELLERLEQLRALWLGIRIQVDVAIEVPPAGVDTPADLERANRVLADPAAAAG